MKRLLAAGLILLLSPVPVSAAIINGGSPVISQSAGQTWIITIEGNVNPDEGVGQVDLYITIGDGVSGDTSTKPVFTAISMEETGYWFDGAGSETPFVDNPTTYDGDSFGSFPALGNGVTRNLAIVTLDASSASLGTWEWSLNEPGYVTLVNSDAASLNNGTITVVPEPAGLVQLLGLVGTGGFGWWLRRRRKCAGK